MFCFFISGDEIVDGHVDDISIDVVDDFLISVKGELFFDWGLFIILAWIRAAFQYGFYFSYLFDGSLFFLLIFEPTHSS